MLVLEEKAHAREGWPGLAGQAEPSFWGVVVGAM